MPSSPGGDESPRRPGFVRSSTGAPGSSAGAGAGGHGHGYGHGHGGSSSALSSLADAAEHHLNPVRSLKRVWSGGLARGGLAALTRTEEEPAGTSGAK